MLILGLLLVLLIRVVSADSWSSLPSERVIAIRSQRDVASNVTIDQLTLTGVRLSTALFNNEGYVNSSLSEVRNLLNIGIQTLLIDLYWSEKSGEFQLCPVDLSSNSSAVNGADYSYYEKNQEIYKCDDVLSVQELLNVVANYASSTDTNLAANIIVLIFNLHDLTTRSSRNTDTSNNTLPILLLSSLGEKLYTPSNLEIDRQDNSTLVGEQYSKDGYPTASHFLFTSEKRVLATIWENHLLSNSTYNITNDFDIIFSPKALESSFTSTNMTTTPTTESEFFSVSNHSWRFAYDDNTTPFNNESLKQFIGDGYSPILNSDLSDVSEVATIFNTSLWSWNASQPLQPEDAKEASPDNDNSRNTQSAYKCAALTPSGWVVSNCYQDKHVVCRTNASSYGWDVSSDENIYFHAEDNCPDETKFSVPKTALEQKSLTEYLTGKLGSNFSVWIDMNSIAISDCWVTGGPYASCPYQKVSSQRNFAQMVSPAAAFCGFIFFAILLQRLKRVPIQDNRKHWKKLLADYDEQEYEGVPS